MATQYTAQPLRDSLETVNEDEVAEVRCSESGVPLPSIPTWYAGVRVKFISEAVRQKSQRSMVLPASLMDPEVPATVRVVGEDEESEVEPALDEELEDEMSIDVDAEADVDAETEAESEIPEA